MNLKKNILIKKDEAFLPSMLVPPFLGGRLGTEGACCWGCCWPGRKSKNRR